MSDEKNNTTYSISGAGYTANVARYTPIEHAPSSGHVVPVSGSTLKITTSNSSSVATIRVRYDAREQATRSIIRRLNER